MAGVLARARFSTGRLALFDTITVNHTHSDGRVALSAIMRWMNPTSPPSHTSSCDPPPKFRSAASRESFRLRRLRAEPAAASSCEAWKGGLHEQAAKRSPTVVTCAKQERTSGW